jgi:hypothetical protein
MSTTEIDGTPAPAALVGDVDAGRAAKVKREISKLVKGTNAATFDLAELLHEVKTKNYFGDWGYESFSKYCKDIEGLKYSKSYYLVAIVSLMKAAGLDRAQFEPVGLTKLRTISVLNKELEKEFNGVPMPLIVNQLTLKASQMTAEEVQYEVDTILGLTEDESMVWVNLHMKKLGRENVFKPALALIKRTMGSIGPDEEGNYKDPSDGQAAEMLAANALADPNLNTDVPAKICPHCNSVVVDYSKQGEIPTETQQVIDAEDDGKTVEQIAEELTS